MYVDGVRDMPEWAVKSGAVHYVLPLVIALALDAVVHGRDVGYGSAAAPVV